MIYFLRACNNIVFTGGDNTFDVVWKVGGEDRLHEDSDIGVYSSLTQYQAYLDNIHVRRDEIPIPQDIELEGFAKSRHLIPHKLPYPV